MRMRRNVENRTLKSAAAEFLAFERAQKVRERTLHDCCGKCSRILLCGLALRESLTGSMQMPSLHKKSSFE